MFSVRFVARTAGQLFEVQGNALPVTSRQETGTRGDSWLLSATTLPRRAKQLLLLAGDAVCVPLVMLIAVLVKAEHWVWPQGDVARAMFAAVALAVPLFARVGMYRAVIRFMGHKAALSVALGVALTASAVAVLVWSGLVAVSYGTVAVFASLLLIYAGASRMALRWVLQPRKHGRVGVVIYGAGDTGIGLAHALSASRDVLPVAFVDDDPGLHETIVAGLEVFAPSKLVEVLAAFDARRVLLAMPRLSREERRRVLVRLESLGAHVQTVPGISDLVLGRARVDDVQDVDVGDLLGRNAVPPDRQLLGGCISGKAVLVTGAGGSIGSELCRQILRLHPRSLLLLEMSELALYSVERDLRAIAERENLEVDIVALLGNAHHKYRVREILQCFGVHTVYHAAAYKHVPIVEHNLIEGLHNNVYSTWYTAEAALECGVETFVLISTDKAVNPTNVMGATKRFAEVVLQGLQQRSSRSRFCMVRFGNVLESSGSVVPLFRDQIRRGGPVTVTHPDVIRYFMTIPEAAQLVLQAGSMATGGDVFVLDMGNPIKIDDLARRMIQLSGMTVRDAANPKGDIEIQYTGLRPAEKLFEELLIGGNVTGTEHPKIMRAVEDALPWVEVQQLLEEIGIAMRRFDCRAARELLVRAVREYRPTPEIEDVVWSRQHREATLDRKVTELQRRRPK